MQVIPRYRDGMAIAATVLLVLEYVFVNLLLCFEESNVGVVRGLFLEEPFRWPGFIVFLFSGTKIYVFSWVILGSLLVGIWLARRRLLRLFLLLVVSQCAFFVFCLLALFIHICCSTALGDITYRMF